MASEVFLGIGGTLHCALIFMMKLGWQSRFRLPILLFIAFTSINYTILQTSEFDEIEPNTYL